MHEVILRPAEPRDFAFCQRLYVDGTAVIGAEARADEVRHGGSFAHQWAFAAVRVIVLAGSDVGWLQTASTDDAIDLGQLYVDRRCRRRGIGQRVLRILIKEARRDAKAIILGVRKLNPARRLYERSGFHVTHEDQHEVYMRCETGRVSP